MVAHGYIPALRWKLTQEDGHEFKTSQNYIVNFRPAWAKELDFVSKSIN